MSAHQTGLVAARELRERSRSRAFYVSLVLMLLGVTVAVVLPALIDDGPGTKDVGLAGSVPAGLPSALESQGASVETTIRIHRFEQPADGQQAVRDGDVDVLVVDGNRLEWQRSADEQLKAVVSGAIQLVAVSERAAAAGISPDQLLDLVRPVELTNVELGQVEGRTADDEAATFVISIALFAAISTYGALVLTGVVEEKSSRTVEVLLARLPARDLLAGKIAGIGLLGLGQVAAVAAVAFVAGAIAGSGDLPAVRGEVLAWTIVWFVLGYALYATVYGTLGSLASRTEDASTVAGPVTIVLMLSFFASFATIGSADTTWARLVSWFPLTAPLAMPSRVAMGTATWWDPVLAALFTLAAIAGLVALGGRIYTRAILHTGSTLSLGAAWRADRSLAPHPAGQPAAMTPRSARAGIHPLPAVVAVAVGVAAGAVTRDVVVGVAAAAGAFVVVKRIRRRHHAPDAEQADERERVSHSS